MSRSFSLASRVLGLALVPFVFSIVPGRAQSASHEPENFLRKYVRLSDVERTAFERGEVVAKLVATTNKRELAVCGVARLAVPSDTFVSRLRDIVAYKKTDAVLQIGRFSNPPRLEDLAGLTLDADDLKALKSCKLGDCGVRMPATQIERFRSEIDWRRKDSGQRATLLARQMLLRYVTAYEAGGDCALAEYRDTKNALSLADETRSLMAASPYLAEYAPEFQTYLENYPAGRLEKVENFIYWSKEKFGLKPVISVTHVTIYSFEKDGVANVIVSSKQLYASRYFDSSLALTVLVEDTNSSARPGTYLIYLNRSRTDQFGGFLGGAKRSIVEGRVVRGMKNTLQATRVRLESDYRLAVSKAEVGE